MRTVEELEALLDEKRRTIDGAHALVMRLTESLEQAEAELETVKRERDEARVELYELWERYLQLDENNDNLIEA